MQFVRIAAVDQRSDYEIGESRLPTTVTLEVLDDEAKILKQAQDGGPLTLAPIPFAEAEKMLEQQDKKFQELDAQFENKLNRERDERLQEQAEQYRLELMRAKDRFRRKQRAGE